MKQCSKCKIKKLLSEFRKDKQKKDGVTSWCGKCIAEQASKYRVANLEKERERGRKKLVEHPEYGRNFKAANPDYDHKYYVKHIEKIREQRCQWYVANAEKARENTRKWCAANPEYNNKYNAVHPERMRKSTRKYRARKLGNGGTITAKEERWLKEFYDFTCLCCGRKEPEIKLTLDHVIPLKLGGRNTIDNAQPLCQSCNSKKHIKNTDYR